MQIKMMKQHYFLYRTSKFFRCVIAVNSNKLFFICLFINKLLLGQNPVICPAIPKSFGEEAQTYDYVRGDCPTSPWALVFHDEFDGHAINTDFWYTYFPSVDRVAADGTISGQDGDIYSRTHDIDYKEDRVLDEAQIFKDENIQVSNGTLKIHYRREDAQWTGQVASDIPEIVTETAEYTSGVLHSKWQAGGNYRYGKFEARIKMTPEYWSAFWLYGGDSDDYSEFDFEMTKKRKISTTIHRKRNIDMILCGLDAEVIEHERNFDFSKFHLFEIEWDPSYVKWFVDKELYYEVRGVYPENNLTNEGQEDCSLVEQNDVFNDNFNCEYINMNQTLNSSYWMPSKETNMFLVINTSLSRGDRVYWASPKNINSNNGPGFPGVMEVDYVRVYQRVANLSEEPQYAGSWPLEFREDLCESAGLSGPDGDICGNGPWNYVFNYQNNLFDGHYQWQIGQGLIMVEDGDDNPNTIRVDKVTNTYTGATYVKVNIESGFETLCQNMKSACFIWLGAPRVIDFHVNFECQAMLEIEAILPTPFNPANFEYDWSFFDPTVMPITNNNIAWVEISQEQTIFEFSLTIANSCATKTYVDNVQVDLNSCEEFGMMWRFTENPAQTSIGVVIDEDGNLEEIDRIVIFNYIKGDILSFPTPLSNYIDIDMRGYPNGLYYAVVVFKNGYRSSKPFWIN